jgi:branched-chain amino acid transport system permease protein
MRNKILLILLTLLFFLTACTSRTPASLPTPAPLSTPALPFDGAWDGSGSDSTGKPFVVTLTIQNAALTGLLYQFPGSDGVSCHAVAYGQIPSAQQPQLGGQTLSATLGEDVELTAFFAGESAHGHLSIHWHDRQPRCNGDYEVDWSAARQASLPPVTAPKNINPHPFQTLLQILVFGLSNGAVLALNAIGVTLIYSTARTLNLAHGDVFALTSALVTTLVNVIGITQGWPPLQLAAALVLVLAASTGLGALLSVGVEQLGFKPFRGRSRLAPVIATLGLSFILYQGALVWRTFQHSWIPGEHRSVPGLPEVPTDGIPNLLPEVNLTQALHLPLQIVIRFSDVFVVMMAVVFVLLTTWFLQRTRSGRAIRALSQNPQAAQLVGVNVDAAITRAFAVGGALAGAAAFIFALYYGRPFGAHGAQSGLLAFAAALLGGIGSPVGALLSGLTIGIVSSLSDYYLSAQWTPVLLLALLVLLLAWRPTGLAASSDAAGNESASVRDAVMLTAPGSSSRVKRWPIVAVALLGLAPLVMQAFHLSGQSILQNVGVFALLALGLNLALGMAGLLDFGFAASFGLGAYAAALLARFDIVFLALIGALAGALLGWIKGRLARRLRGDFFAATTLTLGLLARQVIVNAKTWTGGSGGMGGIPAPHFLTLSLSTPTMKFYLIFGFVLLAAWASARLAASRTGRAWVASSEDESAALASGVDVGSARQLALVWSSALAGLAGALFATTFSYVDPEITMSFHVSALILTMVILGGAGNATGAILGAALIVLYDKVIVNQIADLLALIWPTGLAIGSAPDIRGAAFFNFGLALYLTVWLRARGRRASP